MNVRTEEENYYIKVFEHVSDHYKPFLRNKTNDKTVEKANRKRYDECGYVLSAFLGLYTPARKELHESWLNRVQDLAERAASYVMPVEPTQDVINKIKEAVQQLISSVDDLLDVFKLIIELRRYAELAQQKKHAKGYSLLSLTLHSMACFVIRKFGPDLKPLIEVLQQEKDELQRQPKEDYENPKVRGVNVAGLNEKYYIVTLALGCLNVFDGFNSAYRMKLLPYYFLPTPQEQTMCTLISKPNFKYGAPIIYQTMVCMKYVYEKWYRDNQKKSLIEFINEAINNGRKADKTVNLEDQQIYDLITAPREPQDITKLPGEAPYAYVLTPNGVWYVNKGTNECSLANISKDSLYDLISTYDLELDTQVPTLVDQLQTEQIHLLEQERKGLIETNNDKTVSSPDDESSGEEKKFQSDLSNSLSIPNTFTIGGSPQSSHSTHSIFNKLNKEEAAAKESFDSTHSNSY